jgi:hypothetical protein
MLDDLWAKRVTNLPGPAGRSDLVLDLAAAMAERESLWIPLALFEDRLPLIEHLIGMQVLSRGGSGTSVGFSHQTLFEHAWARAFARQKSRLSDYAVARQNGLFIRPTVWASLNYLRGADRATYRQEFGRLWTRIGLRPHLRHLLIEFLGTVPDPDVQEQAWLFGTLSDPSQCTRALASVRGNPGWFDLMADGHLPALMRENAAAAHLLLGILIAAYPHARDTCLRLVRDAWAENPEKDSLTFSALANLPVWDEDAVALACRVIRRGRVDRSSALYLAAQVLELGRELAPRIVAAAFERELEELERQPDPALDPLPDDATETDRIVRRMSYRPRERFRRLIDDSNGWFGVDEVAEQAPAAFLREIWPLFTRTLEWLLDDATEQVDRYARDYTLGMELTAVPDSRSRLIPANLFRCATPASLTAAPSRAACRAPVVHHRRPVLGDVHLHDERRVAQPAERGVQLLSAGVSRQSSTSAASASRGGGRTLRERAYLAAWGEPVRVHFVPKYAPDTNPVEEVWWRLHEAVTRNHRCHSMQELGDSVFGTPCFPSIFIVRTPCPLQQSGAVGILTNRMLDKSACT